MMTLKVPKMKPVQRAESDELLGRGEPVRAEVLTDRKADSPAHHGAATRQ